MEWRNHRVLQLRTYKATQTEEAAKTLEKRHMQVADWLTSGEWDVTPKRIAQRFKMEEEAVNLGLFVSLLKVELSGSWVAL